jgi:hypothetical protein
MNEEDLSPPAANLLNIIRRGKLTSKGQHILANLPRLRENVSKNQVLSEVEKSFLLEEIKKHMQAQDIRRANKIYGTKEAVAKADLQAIYDELSKRYDFDKSIVKQGVKIGGDMIAGRVFVDVYFSFKNEEKWHIIFARSQNTVKDEQVYKVAIYWSGRDDLSLKETSFKLTEKAQAINLFEKHLVQLI